jgi:hypothetical protein
VITRTGRLPLGCLPVGRQVRPSVDRKAPRGLKNPLRRVAYARSPKGHETAWGVNAQDAHNSAMIIATTIELLLLIDALLFQVDHDFQPNV